MTESVVAIDIGGTKIAAAIVNRDQHILEFEVVATLGAQGAEAIIQRVVELANKVSSHSNSRVIGVGVGTAGVVNAQNGSIVSSTDTLVGWAGTKLADRLRQELATLIEPGGIVSVQNDVDAHAAGEFRYGAAAGAQSAVVVGVGTGVGAGIIIGGKPLRGAHHVAGEIAHIPVPGAEHLRCTCGGRGHLEAIGSGIGMHRHFLSLGGARDVKDARAMVPLVLQGEPIATRALQESAAAVGKGIAAAVTLIDPEVVVVTGGVAGIGNVWWEPMERSFRAEVIDVLQGTRVVPGVLGQNAPLLGAAAAVWDAKNGKE